MAAVLPIKPIFEVFSRRCGVSEMTDAGMAIVSLFFFMGRVLLSRGFLGGLRSA